MERDHLIQDFGCPAVPYSSHLLSRIRKKYHLGATIRLTEATLDDIFTTTVVFKIEE